MLNRTKRRRKEKPIKISHKIQSNNWISIRIPIQPHRSGCEWLPCSAFSMHEPQEWCAVLNGVSIFVKIFDPCGMYGSVYFHYYHPHLWPLITHDWDWAKNVDESKRKRKKAKNKNTFLHANRSTNEKKHKQLNRYTHCCQFKRWQTYW